MYAIVEFETSPKCIEAVPLTWLHKNYCLWPPRMAKHLIENCVVPQSDWDQHCCRIIKMYGKY